MQFLIIAYDSTDSDAINRRMAVRDEHMQKVRALRDQKKALFGGAMLDDEGKMIGSVIVVDFPSRKELDEWLATDEPYVSGKVWENITVMPYKVAGHFQELIDAGFEALS